MKTYLRLEIYADNARARILKRLTRAKGTHPELRKDLQSYREEVRKELRSEHLALGFLRGRTHAQMEKPLRPRTEGHVKSLNLSRTFPDFERIQELVEHFGELYFDTKQELLQKFSEWRDNAIGV